MSKENEPKKSKKEYIFEKLDDISDITEPLVNTTGKLIAATTSAFEITVPVIVPITKFVPLISEIGSVLNEIIEIVQTAEHNKRICDALLQRVYAVELAVLDLKVRRNVNQEYFNTNNYLGLQSLANIISQIKKFTAEISQMKTMIKYLKGKSIEKTFKELCSEFDSCVSLLSFSIVAKDKINEAEQLKADQEELNKYLEEMGIEIKKVGTNVKTIEIDVKRVGNDVEQVGNDVKEIETDVKELVTEIKQIKQNTENYPDMVLKITAMHNTMEKLTKQTDQSKINKIFQFHNLTFEDYVQGDDRRDDGQVTKWMCDRHQEFAFKVIGDDENDKNSVQNQVTILKEFQDWQNIIKFYGLTNDGSKTYLVTEWAEFGNLREYYTSFRQRFELLKLKLCLDIARGLNFLRTVDIVHRDVRAENIFITVNEVAKLGNFKLSRPLTGPTKKQNQNLERVRYCAPELLERVQNFKYNHKCEVYSFGILLWEIAETRIPYAKYDIMSITDLILKKKYREPFSENNGMSEKFKELVNKAVNPDPDFRPKLSKMVNILGECNKEYVRLSLSDVSSSNFSQSKPKLPTPKRTFSIDNDYEFAIKDENLQDFESFNYMTLAEAEKQHKMVDKNGSPAGDLKNAYKCFEAFARRKQIKAKYYKAYYISKGYDDLDLSTKDKEIMIAGLFKEVANDEANEFPEAKLRYGDCLYHGKGVDQNLTEALKYFEKAAEDGLRVAMYNVGNLYYNGCNGKKDEAKAIHYMKLAAYHEYTPAIYFCKEHNIPL